MKQNLIIFASGTKTDGGTGAENLAQKLPGVKAIFVSNHAHGGLSRRAKTLCVPFFYFPGPYTTEGYQELVQKICTELDMDESTLWYALSGWFRMVRWLPSKRTWNIHPAPLPRFGGKGMYGEKLHLAVWEAYQRGEIAEGEIVMHFVTEDCDAGQVFFRFPFSLSGIGSYQSYRTVVRTLEHAAQPFLADLVMRGEISWDGVHPESLKVPEHL